MLKAAARALYTSVYRWALAPVLYHEWRHPPHGSHNERPVEYAYALRWLARLSPQHVLDVGSGTTAWPHILANCGFKVTAIDAGGAYWRRGFFNRHYWVVKDDITRSRLTQSFDFITCISVLEHIPDHAAAVTGMFQRLSPGGHLLLTFPYNEERYVPDAYALIDRDVKRRYVCQIYSRRQVRTWLEENGGELVDQEYYRVFVGEYWGGGERLRSPEAVTLAGRPHLTCILVRKMGRA